MREDRHERRARPQRQRGQRRRRRGGPVEEVHRHGVGALDVLIDQDGHALVGLRARAARAGARPAGRSRWLPVARPRALEQRVQVRIVERPRQHGHRRQDQGVGQPVQLPVAEVARRTASRPCPAASAARTRSSPSNSTRRQELGRRQRARTQQRDQRLPEVDERRARDRAGTRPPSARETPRAAARPPAAGARRRPRRTSRPTSAPSRAPPRPARRHHAPARPPPAAYSSRCRRPVTTCSSRTRDRRSSSQARNASAGSMRHGSGTAATGTGSGRSGSSRTASFSVVSTTAAPVSRTARGHRRAISAGVIPVVIAETVSARPRASRRPRARAGTAPAARCPPSATTGPSDATRVQPPARAAPGSPSAARRRNTRPAGDVDARESARTPGRPATAPSTITACARPSAPHRLAQPPERHRPVAQVLRASRARCRRRARGRDAGSRRRARGPSRRAPSRPGPRRAPARSHTSTAAPGTARASISGSSPLRSRSASRCVPSLTTTTPSIGRRRRSRG